MKFIFIQNIMGVLQLPTHTHTPNTGPSREVFRKPFPIHQPSWEGDLWELLGYHKICSLKGEQKTQKRLCSMEVPTVVIFIGEAW